MNIIDVVIVLMIALAGVVGLKRGVFKQVVITIGTIFVFWLAFQLKDPLANFLSQYLPFFNFFGSFKGVVVLNIILYQLLAFILILGILMAVLNLLIGLTGIFEKILKFTIVLGIPSKILGFIVGLIEGYIIIFVVLFFLRQPAVNIDIFNQSKLMPKILNGTPMLSKVVSNMNETVSDVYDLTKKFGNGENTNQFNLDALDVMLKHKVIRPDYVDTLVKKGKLDTVIGINTVIDRYR